MGRNDALFIQIQAMIEQAVEEKILRIYQQDALAYLPGMYEMVRKILATYPVTTPEEFLDCLARIGQDGPQTLLELLRDERPIRFQHRLEIHCFRRKSKAVELRKHRSFVISEAYTEMAEAVCDLLGGKQFRKHKQGVSLFEYLTQHIQLHHLTNIEEFQALPLWGRKQDMEVLNSEVRKHLELSVLLVIDSLKIQDHPESFRIPIHHAKLSRDKILFCLNIIFADLPRQLAKRPLYPKKITYGNRGDRSTDRALFLNHADVGLVAKMTSKVFSTFQRIKGPLPKNSY